MVLPLETHHILENTLIDASSADIDSDIFVRVSCLEELSNGFDIVAVKFLDS